MLWLTSLCVAAVYSAENGTSLIKSSGAATRRILHVMEKKEWIKDGRGRVVPSGRRPSVRDRLRSVSRSQIVTLGGIRQI